MTPLGAATASATFTNPTPAASDWFGSAVAAVGTNRVLIGAPNDDTGAMDAGAAYLFNTNGALVRTFTNPAPQSLAYFGMALAALGTDRVLIGSPGDSGSGNSVGAAYLFSTNGTVLATFTNPAPVVGDFFGGAVAAVGTDKVLIAADAADIGAGDAGVVYLFSTNGTRLVTYTNPTPASFDTFGYAVAAVGADKVLIGANGDNTGASDAGAAYLFSTNGALVRTFTNPAPVAFEAFGSALAGVGADRVLIGAYGFSSYSGRAYLFSTNGTLQTIFTNPTPANADAFGISVAAVGTDKVLIGASQDDTALNNAGAAYLFSLDGTLLATFVNPNPTPIEYFGYAVAGVGADKVLIGAYQNDTGATDAGTAYLFNVVLAAPRLNIERSTNGLLRLSWPLSASSFVLELTDHLVTPPATNTWTTAPFARQTNATQISVIVNPDLLQFFRLRGP